MTQIERVSHVQLTFSLAYLARVISSAVLQAGREGKSNNPKIGQISDSMKYFNLHRVKAPVYQWYLLQAFPQPPGGGPDCAALMQGSLGRRLLFLLLHHCLDRPHRHDVRRNGTQQQLAPLQFSNGLDQRTISARKSIYKHYARFGGERFQQKRKVAVPGGCCLLERSYRKIYTTSQKFGIARRKSLILCSQMAERTTLYPLMVFQALRL